MLNDFLQNSVRYANEVNSTENSTDTSNSASVPQTVEPPSFNPIGLTGVANDGGVGDAHTSASVGTDAGMNAGAGGGVEGGAGRGEGGGSGGGGVVGVVNAPTELVTSVQFHSIAEFLNVLSAGALQHGAMHNLRSRIWVTFRCGRARGREGGRASWREGESIFRISFVFVLL